MLHLLLKQKRTQKIKKKKKLSFKSKKKDSQVSPSNAQDKIETFLSITFSSILQP